MNLRLAWTVLVGACLSSIGSASAQQPGFSAQNLPLVMTAYVEAVVDMRAAYETCVQADKRPAEWEQGSALLVESLEGRGPERRVSPTGSKRVSPRHSFALRVTAPASR